ncbi:MAG TPA: hypothetical protein PKM21_18470, partial [Anaerolineales bacterium]|nr:hypothetical protein [Anaerolineales bacterium]
MLRTSLTHSLTHSLMSDASGSTSWAYDSRGRLVVETKNVTGSGAFRSEWAYNSADLVTMMKYPANNAGEEGEQVNYSYHPQMLLNTVGGTLGTYVRGTDYDDAGRVQLRRMGTTLQVDYAYYNWTAANGVGRLQSIYSYSGPENSPTSLQDLEYTYNALGSVTTIKDYLAAGGTQTQTF